jgi:hypothetical protein
MGVTESYAAITSLSLEADTRFFAGFAGAQQQAVVPGAPRGL